MSLNLRRPSLILYRTYEAIEMTSKHQTTDVSTVDSSITRTIPSYTLTSTLSMKLESDYNIANALPPKHGFTYYFYLLYIN